MIFLNMCQCYHVFIFHSEQRAETLKIKSEKSMIGAASTDEADCVRVTSNACRI